MKTTLKNLSENAERIIERACRGEEVIIIHEGKPLAKLVSLDYENTNHLDEDNLFGIWRNHPRLIDTENYVLQIRQGRFDN